MPLGERLHRRRLTLLGATLVLAGGLAACTSGGGAELEPTATATGVPSAAPSDEPTSERPEVEKPVPPETMARDDVAGAEAAAQYFLELYPYVYSTGDLTEWKAMSDPECLFCSDVVDDVTELHGSDGYQVGGLFEITKMESRAPEGEGQYFAVWIDADEEPIQRLSADGGLLGSSPGGPIEIDMAVHKTEHGWIIRGVETFDPSVS